jgi:hypothetical protein
MVYSVVACCSTLPDRVHNGALERAVRSILEQTVPVERVFVHYPTYSKRLKQPYPDPPAALRSMDRVSIVRVEDFGPLTKSYPITHVDDVSDTTAVLLFDDDRIYPKEWMTPLYAHFVQQNRKHGVGYHGSLAVYGFKQRSDYNRTSKLRRVGMLGTSWGAMYPRKAFPESAKKSIASLHALPESAYTNDDIVLGVWAHRARVSLYTCPTTPTQRAEWERVNAEDDLLLAQHRLARQSARARMLVNDSSALATSPSQSGKQLRLTLTLLCSNRLPVLVVYAVIGVIICLIIVLVPVAVVVAKKRRGRYHYDTSYMHTLM